MVVVNELDADWVYLEDDPLVHRLAALQWTDVPEEVRDRCWDRISPRVASVQDEFVRAHNVGERYAFSRRSISRRLPLAHGLSRRPSHVGALTHAQPALL